MPFNLLRQLLQHINLSLSRLAFLKTLHDLLCPLGALAAWRTLATAFMLVELAQAANCADNIRALVHNDDSRGAKTGLAVLEGIEIHGLVIADVLRKNWRGGTARYNGFEVVPTARESRRCPVAKSCR